GHSTGGISRSAGGSYGSLQPLMNGGLMGTGVGMLGGTGALGIVGGGALGSQALPLGYPDPLLLHHAASVLNLAAGVLREAAVAQGGEEEDNGVGVVGR
ncbi:unnamed protein product, partial [Sphacelaria rigidula]